MSKGLRWLIASMVFIAVISYMQITVGWQNVLAQWQQLSITQLLLITALTFISYYLRAYRSYYYFGKALNHPFSLYVRINFLHNALNNFLPMRLGEASFPLFMKQTFNYSILRASSGLLLIRLMDLHWLLLLLSLLAALQINTLFWLLTLGWVILPFIVWHIFPFLLLKLPKKLQQKVQLLSLEGPIEERKEERNAALFLAKVYCQTACIWLIKLAALVFIFSAFIELDGFKAIFAVVSADLSSVLPIHGLAGSGTFEAAILAALLPFGLQPERILVAAVNLHIYVLAVTLLSVPIALCIQAKPQVHKNEIQT
ncbi:lysylphosphatidylglycerol synthase transmembrane domain-containing protein [Catenovulum sediminis]|uniref:lysylphosphatidylglycerol synthase transmembrane domain-containing protein n=1 Tax=Catenovulum sediminis TaxID=1740262 RepID=UPI001180C595|nr:lysylphosphatidylglycerol synthase transmembrane domain-containing protein [Catenovulum sediminis]